MASKVFILFDAYHREPNKRTVQAVFATREAAEAERIALQGNGGMWEIEEHDLLARIDRGPRLIHAD